MTDGVRARILHLHHVPGLLPSHVCIVTPERLGLCGAVSWLDTKATNELDPTGAAPQIVPKEKAAIDGVDAGRCQVLSRCSGARTLYSLFQDPMTSCGCFECICGVEPVSMVLSSPAVKHS